MSDRPARKASVNTPFPESDIVLNGKPYSLQPNTYSVATQVNPPGLRTAGGNILREYGQWSETEWDNFSKGAGSRSPDDGGFLHSSCDTINGGFRLQARAQSVYIHQPYTQVTDSPWGAYFAQVGNYLFMGVGNKLCVVSKRQQVNADGVTDFVPYIEREVCFGYKTTGEPQTFNPHWYGGFNINTSTNNKYVFDCPYWPMENKGTFGTYQSGDIKPGFRIVGLAAFGEWLAICIQPPPSGLKHGDKWKTSKPTDKSAVDPMRPTQWGVSGIYLLKVDELLAGDPWTQKDSRGIACLEFCGTANHVYTYQPEPQYDETTNVPQINEPYEFPYSAHGCKVIDGYLYFWSNGGIFYTNGQIVPGLSDGDNPFISNWATRNWQWAGARLPACTDTETPSNWYAESIGWLNGEVNQQPVGVSRHVITGIVSLAGDRIAESTRYVSTNRNLYALLPGDVFAHVTEWGLVRWWNGVGAREHDGDAYFPVGDGMVRVTSTGQIIYMGLDTLPAPPRFHARRHGPAMASVNGTLMSMSEVGRWDISGPYNYNIFTRVWGYKGQGWHSVASKRAELGSGVDPAWVGRSLGMHFDTARSTVWWVTTPELGAKDFRIVLNTIPVTQNLQATLADQIIEGANYIHNREGYLILPPFDGGATQLFKDWNSVALYGSGFTEGTKLEVYYKFSEGIAEEFGVYGDIYYTPDWVSLGKVHFTRNMGGVATGFVGASPLDGGLILFEFPVPRVGKSRAIMIMVRILQGNVHPNANDSPWIRAIRLEYHANIRDYLRFSLGISLPWDCMYDRCGEPWVGYDQELWDDNIRAAHCSEVPVKFIDVDRREYWVRVDSATRRIVSDGTTGRVNPQAVEDFAWTLTMTQLKPDSVCGPSVRALAGEAPRALMTREELETGGVVIIPSDRTSEPQPDRPVDGTVPDPVPDPGTP